MKPLRCLIARPSKGILEQLVDQLLALSPDVEVVGRVDHVEDIAEVATITRAEMVLFSLPYNQMGAVYQILNQHAPQLAVCNLYNDGRQLALHVNNISQNDFLRIIRSLKKETDHEI